MTESMEARLLALIEGRLEETERDQLLSAVAESPELQHLLEDAQRGYQALVALPVRAAHPLFGDPSRATAASHDPPNRQRQPVPWMRRRISVAWTLGAVAATLAVAIPMTRAWSAPGPRPVAPAAATNEFLVVLHGEWPDIGNLTPEARGIRRGEYWAWAQELVADGALIGAGELSPEPGTRLAQGGISFTSGGALERNPEFVVGMFVLRAPDYDAAVRLAESGPHVRHGGSVTVRAFNTVVGFRP